MNITGFNIRIYAMYCINHRTGIYIKFIEPVVTGSLSFYKRSGVIRVSAYGGVYSYDELAHLKLVNMTVLI